MKKLIVLGMIVVFASPAMADIVTNDVIFGDGNANGSFTVDRGYGVELGLRAKLRHDATGQPQNIFNYDGNSTYYFNSGVAPLQSFPTAEWSFEWSINTDYLGGNGVGLNDLRYELGMSSSLATDWVFDPINLPYADHGIGNNSTANGAGDDDVPGRTAADYADLIEDNNLAQNSWKPQWFAADFDPTAVGTYDFTLSAFDATGFQVAATTITVDVSPVPVPGAFLLGFIGLGFAGHKLRRRRVR